MHDPAYATPSGFQEMDFTPIWTRKGKYKLTPKEYMDVIEAFKPDVYVALYDGDTKINSSRKRLSNAIRRTTTFFEKCFSIHSSSETLKSSEILGVIEGGYDKEARAWSIEFLKDKPLIGYVIDGLHNNGSNVKDISTEQIKEIVEYTVVSNNIAFLYICIFFIKCINYRIFYLLKNLKYQWDAGILLQY